jgi:hypothetical protein
MAAGQVEIIGIVASAVSAVLLLLLSTISWFLRDKVKDGEQRVARLEERTRELELQGKERDAELKQISGALESIGELRAELAIRYVSRDELAKIFGKLERIESEVTNIRLANASEHANNRRRRDTDEVR